MVTVHIKPVHSKPDDSSNTDLRIQSGIKLGKHQAETLRAILHSDSNVVFNLAMTGDGKSLAAYLPALLYEKPVLAMYPTNELICDQSRQLDNYQPAFGTNHNVDTMFSEKLYEIRDELQLRTQGKAIEYLTRQNPILLTNPDIFNLIANFKYLAEHQNPDALFAKVIGDYDIFIFDEFHVYDVAQVNSVLTSLIYVLEQSRNLSQSQRKKFLFLSATPNPMLVECLQRAGITPKIIEGCYDYSDSPTEGWRTILQPVQLNFHSVGRQTEEWIRTNWRLIANWFREHPNSHGAIIVNSVALVKRIIQFFHELQQEGNFPLTFEENTGLHRGSLDCQLVIGTSTIDVGVDFKINFLIFEALDAGTWIQRLGRLGRHISYVDERGKEVQFDSYAAHSLLPRYSYERIEEKLSAIQEIDRERLYTFVRDSEKTEGIFSPVNDFHSYQCSWGWLSAAHVLNTLRHPRLRENYAQTAERLAQTYKSVFGIDISERLNWYFYLLKNCEPFIEEAVIKFRGETPFDCGVLDETDDRIKTYNLLWILRNADVSLISKTKFLDEVKRRGLNEAQFKHLDIYLRLHRYLEESNRVWIEQRKNIYDEFQPDDYRKPKILAGFRVAGNNIPEAYKINPKLERKPLLCLISQMQIDELKARLLLPAMFPLYRLKDVYGNEFSVAFSREALMLSSQPLIFGGGNEDV